MLKLLKPWDSQPQEVVDWSSETRPTHLFNGAIDGLDNTPVPSLVGSPVFATTRAGRGRSLNGSSQAINTGRKFTSANGTIILFADFASASGGSTCVACQASNDAGSNVGLGWQGGALKVAGNSTSSAGWSSGLHCLAGTWGAGGVKAYVDGVADGTNAYTGAPTAPAGDYNFEIGCFRYNGGRLFWAQQTTLLLAVFDFALTQAQIAQYCRPDTGAIWQLFAPRSIWVPVSSSTSGTSHTITPSGGITFTGSGTEVNTKILDVSGGVAFAGTGSITFAGGGTTHTIIPSGGITFGGTGTEIDSKVFIPTGGFTFGGTATIVDGKIFPSSGGISFSGTGSMSSNTTPVSTQTGERTKVGAGA